VLDIYIWFLSAMKFKSFEEKKLFVEPVLYSFISMWIPVGVE